MLTEALDDTEEGEDHSTMEANIEGSQEIKLVSEVDEHSCLNRPPNLALASPRQSLPLSLRPKEEIKDAVAAMNSTEIAEQCDIYGLSCSITRSRIPESVRKEVRMRISEASDELDGDCGAMRYLRLI